MVFSTTVNECVWYLHLFTGVLDGGVEWSWLFKWLDWAENYLINTFKLVHMFTVLDA